jgi:hypothetical protein
MIFKTKKNVSRQIFYFVTDAADQGARVLTPGKPFQTNFMFTIIARAYHLIGYELHSMATNLGAFSQYFIFFVT